MVVLGGLMTGGGVAQEVRLDELLGRVEAVSRGYWIGWTEKEPTEVYQLQVGEKPTRLGTLAGNPVGVAIGHERVVWVGEGFRAVLPLSGTRGLKTEIAEGAWRMAAAGTEGFVVSDGTGLWFSTDGEHWRKVDSYEVPENTRIVNLK